VRRRRFQVSGCALAGQLYLGQRPPRQLTGHGWRRTEPVLDDRGRQVSAIWEDDSGNVFLPFDPAEVMQVLWSERYHPVLRRLVRGTAVRGYYLVRPLLPRGVQLGLRRTLAKRQVPPDFPAWPVEPGLHDFYEWLFGVLARLTDEPVAYIHPWPDGKDWAMVLTHDVETATGLQEMELLRAPERDRGYRSSWNFVPERYQVSDADVEAVRADGCEVGVHGLKHDGRDVASVWRLRRRLPAMRAWADRWGAVGFRSPATQRHWGLMPRLGFEYDSSYTDTDPYEPQPGGCCTYLPFFIENMVELPITLPQDHTLFEILGHRDGSTWVSKASVIRDRGGMVLALAHPDYARKPGVLGAWCELLDAFAGDETAWQALPHEVATWWRQRAATQLQRTTKGWQLTGPAAPRARIRTTAALRSAALCEPLLGESLRD
jgi:hypothetical protein